MVELRSHERKILSILSESTEVSVDHIAGKYKLADSTIMRAALTLKEKGLLEIYAKPETRLKLNAEGKLYSENGLPERRLFNAIIALGGKASLNHAAEKAGLDEQVTRIALGWILRKKWTTYDSKNNILQTKSSPEDGNDEKLLKSFHGEEQISLNNVKRELQDAVSTLKKRQFLTAEEKTQRTLAITASGKRALQEGIEAAEEVTQLTPEKIITGKWRTLTFQKYNIDAPVAKTWPGKKHPYLSFLEEVRAKLVTLGFKEMTGTSVEASFFNFDALYTPQDHPAREEVGIYFVKDPKFGDISAYDTAVKNVKATHENGWTTCSSGWGYKYSLKEAKRLILRGHGTCLSARTLLSKNLEVPNRYFSIARCYRPEVVDKTHLSEFNQVEGIVVDESLTLRDLLGVLSKFAVEIAGADKVRFKPDYFPFTEPSVELSAYKKGYGWVEFGGSGIFRPEVTLPLGVKVPVIAWGLGVDRLFMMRAGIDDIRDIFSQDLDWLRRKQVV